MLDSPVLAGASQCFVEATKQFRSGDSKSANASTDCETCLLNSSRFWEEETCARRKAVVCDIMKATFRKTCCMLASLRSSCFLLYLRCSHAPVLTLIGCRAVQLAGLLYLSKIILNFSGVKVFPQRLLITSANMSLTLVPRPSEVSIALAKLSRNSTPIGSEVVGSPVCSLLIFV